MTRKQASKEIDILSLRAQQTLKIASHNQAKIDENPVSAPPRVHLILLPKCPGGAREVPKMVLPGASRVLPRCQNGPPGCQQNGGGSAAEAVTCKLSGACQQCLLF